MVYRVYSEKVQGFSKEPKALLSELEKYLKIKGLESIRILHRYDADNIEKADFEKAIRTVFSEPQLDAAYTDLDISNDARILAIEALPGQFDQRADSAAQCIQLMTAKERPRISYAKLYVFYGNISDADFEKIKNYLINPVESREAELKLPENLEMEIEEVKEVETLKGFLKLDKAGLTQVLTDYSLAMDLDDISFVQSYFCKINREPTISEIRVMDTYWSDHCRHTTFLTELENIVIEDEEIKKSFDEYLKQREALSSKKPVTLMDIATISAKSLKKQGKLEHMDESEEINACTLKIKADTKDGEKDWLLLFKNETHNHPTEIEPFGGAATCIGGAIRDPLSARSYVYASMRISGAGDPRQDINETLKGKLPQRKICLGAADGFSSYGNQIGLATGLVKEIYHKGYTAKRLEAGAVLGAAPYENVRREVPKAGDIVILLGGRTGRDGIGGATGSSKAHDVKSVDKCSSQVQKGNAPEERKLQRLFLNKKATRLIKRCNDFGAGGVAVAIGEIADGLIINLDKIIKKYEGLDATELAISESQERMAIVIEAKDLNEFLSYASAENLEATPLATVTEEKRLVMLFKGKKFVDLDREFLSSNGAKKKANVRILKQNPALNDSNISLKEGLNSYVKSLQGASLRGLSERFDSTIGAGTVLMPFGGKNQKTQPMAMVHKLPVEGGTNSVSFMAYGYNPDLSEISPYYGAYFAVIDSVAKLVASGADYKKTYLSFQEYFPRLGKDETRWGLPLSALLGAFRAQSELNIAAIGGKDSMSGSFESIDVPPTLISFAVSWGKLDNVVSPEFKKAGSYLLWLKPREYKNNLPSEEALKANFELVRDIITQNKALSVSSIGEGGLANSLFNAAVGNFIGAEINAETKGLFDLNYGSFLVETDDIKGLESYVIGRTLSEAKLVYNGEEFDVIKGLEKNENVLEGVYSNKTESAQEKTEKVTSSKPSKISSVKIAKPRVLIPAFPGTNCELDTKRAFDRAGALTEIFLVKNLKPSDVEEAAKEMARRISMAQIVLIPGGFSGGDEPDGSAKLISSFLRNKEVRNAISELLDKNDGLMGGICNGFQALIKLGLVPYGKITEPDTNSPTLSYNVIGRHQSRLVNVRQTSSLSPWFNKGRVGDITKIAISHGEGRFVCDKITFGRLALNGQILSQYVDDKGEASMDVLYNPAGSMYAVEAVCSEDGRVMGRMGHSERMVQGLYKNIPDVKEDPLFKSAVEYYL